MIATLATLLIANGAFNLIAWPTFYRRVAKDQRARDERGKPTRFLTVHRVLVGIALLLAAASLIAAIWSLTVGM